MEDVERRLRRVDARDRAAVSILPLMAGVKARRRSGRCARMNRVSYFHGAVAKARFTPKVLPVSEFLKLPNGK